VGWKGGRTAIRTCLPLLLLSGFTQGGTSDTHKKDTHACAQTLITFKHGTIVLTAYTPQACTHPSKPIHRSARRTRSCTFLLSSSFMNANAWSGRLSKWESSWPSIMSVGWGGVWGGGVWGGEVLGVGAVEVSRGGSKQHALDEHRCTH